MTTDLTRRGFLGTTGKAAAAAATATGVLTRPGRAVAQNDKVVVGLIGCGGMGKADCNQFMKNPEVQIAALCDVDGKHLESYAAEVEKQSGRKPDQYRDFRQLIERKDLNAVIVGTPDHWHALPTIYACEAGKDVYVEKPLAHSVIECRAMVNAARRHNRVVQVGTWQRSSAHMQSAVELVQSGQLGDISVCRAWMVRSNSGIGNPADGEAPPELDYDMWLGPAPKRPYNSNRSHYNFRWFYDYAGALMTDWGVHLIDVVLWAMNVKTPLAVNAVGGKFVLDDNRDTPDTLIATYQFPDFVLQWEHREGNGRGLDGGDGHGIEFIGRNGTLMLDRGRWRVVPETYREGNETKSRMEAKEQRASGGLAEHIRNFLDCLKTRERTRSDVEIMHHTTITCHLGNVAYLAGKKVYYDAKMERCVTGPVGNGRVNMDRVANEIQLVERDYRRPWSIDRSYLQVARADTVTR